MEEKVDVWGLAASSKGPKKSASSAAGCRCTWNEHKQPPAFVCDWIALKENDTGSTVEQIRRVIF